MLFDLGYVTSAEPYRKLFNQGMIQAFAYPDSCGVYVPAEEVTESGGKFFYNGEQVSHGNTGSRFRALPRRRHLPRLRRRAPLRVYGMCSWARSIGPGHGPQRDVIGSQRFLQPGVVASGRPTGSPARGPASRHRSPPGTPSAAAQTIARCARDFSELRDSTAVARADGTHGPPHQVLRARARARRGPQTASSDENW